MVLDLILAALAVAFALSTLETIDTDHHVYGAGRILASLAVAVGSLVALGVSGAWFLAVAAPAVTYCGAALHSSVDHLITRASVIGARQRVPRL